MEEKIKHVIEDLSCAMYEYIEENEENNFKNINVTELEQLSKIIKNLTESLYYCNEKKDLAQS